MSVRRRDESDGDVVRVIARRVSTDRARENTEKNKNNNRASCDFRTCSSAHRGLYDRVLHRPYYTVFIPPTEARALASTNNYTAAGRRVHRARRDCGGPARTVVVGGGCGGRPRRARARQTWLHAAARGVYTRARRFYGLIAIKTRRRVP